jgi:hypothetical protein
MRPLALKIAGELAEIEESRMPLTDAITENGEPKREEP